MPPHDRIRPRYDFVLGDLGRDRGPRGRVFREISPGGRVLDVGCDTGRFGEALKRLKHCEVHGIERDEQAVLAARERLAVVHDRSIDHPDAFDDLGPYDAVLFFDVLEHLTDPWAVLVRAARTLRPGGCIFAIVPNVAHVSVVRRLLLGRFEYAEHGIMDRTHLRWFTRSSLELAFREAGLERIKVESVPLVPRLDDTTKAGSRAAHLLAHVLPHAFSGSWLATGYASLAFGNGKAG
jgi:2-polyprenyl-3-methyl-5-hydroxy-6-metoxy-1,4-benzoquinol methylase